MSIVKMQRLRLIALAQDRDALLDRLLHAGCVELSEPSAYLADDDWAQLLHRDAGCLPELKSQAGEFRQALDVLAKYAPYKGGMFAARGTIKERDLLDREAAAAALEKAREINGRAKELGQLAAREAVGRRAVPAPLGELRSSPGGEGDPDGGRIAGQRAEFC